MKTAAGDTVDTVETDDNGQFSVDLPGPGDYVVSLDAKSLPEGVKVGPAGTRAPSPWTSAAG